jgi:ABC-type nickel/cobalt efflux system permease component RcnA
VFIKINVFQLLLTAILLTILSVSFTRTVPQAFAKHQSEVSVREQEGLYRRFIIYQRKGIVIVNKGIWKLKERFNINTYLLLMLFSFGYGVLHALGPGHGKMIVTSYFLQRKSKTIDALKLAAIIAFIHTGAALLLALLYMTVLSQVRGLMRIKMQTYFTFFSGFLIIFLGIVLLLQKIKTKKTQEAIIDKPLSQNLWLAGIPSGIIPCPVALTIMLVAIPAGIVYVGITSVIGMSFGLALVLFVIGTIVVKSKQKIVGSINTPEKEGFLHLIFNYAGISAMFLIGFFIILGNLHNL